MKSQGVKISRGAIWVCTHRHTHTHTLINMSAVLHVYLMRCRTLCSGDFSSGLPEREVSVSF